MGFKRVVGFTFVCVGLFICANSLAADETAKFNGKWKGVAQINGQSVTIESIHDSSGYKNYVILPNGAMPAGNGSYSAADGKWSAKADNGADSGTYQFIDADTVNCKDIAGNVVVWTRDNSPLPQIIGAPVPAPAPAPAPVAGATSTPLSAADRKDIEAKLRTGDFAGAWNVLSNTAALKSFDPDAIALDAAIRVGLRQFEVARCEAALVMEQPGHLNDAVALGAYVQAQAALGYLIHARSDLELYKSLKLDDTAGLEKSMNDLAAIPPAGCAADQVLNQFDALVKLAGNSKDADALIQQATVLLKGRNNISRTEFDTYIERKRALTTAANAQPRSAAKLADLAQFLLDESQQLHGNTGFGYKAFLSFRAANPTLEQQQAVAYCDQALQLDARCAQAHAVKAGALLELGDDDPAGAELAAALQIDPNDPKTLKLLSNLMAKQSWANTSAGDQYTTPIMTEDDEFVYIKSRSESDLAPQARYYYGLASQEQDTATRALQTAAKVTSGSGDSFYYASALAIRAGDKPAAVADMTQAVNLSPDNSYYHMYLGKLDTELSRPDLYGSWNQYSLGVNLYQTSVNKLICLAWHELRLRDYDGAKLTLEQAKKIDSSDPHVAAYIAFMLAGQSNDQADVDQSAAYLCAAWALNQAYMRMVSGQVSSTPMTFGGNDAGLEMALAATAAQRLLRLHRPELGYGILKISLDDGSHVTPSDMNTLLRTAALPIPAVQDPIVAGPRGMENVKVAELHPMTYWLRTLHQMAATALTALGQRAAAQQEMAAANAIRDVVNTNINPGRTSDAPLRR